MTEDSPHTQHRRSCQLPRAPARRGAAIRRTEDPITVAPVVADEIADFSAPVMREPAG
jgi:hypothetical protein